MDLVDHRVLPLQSWKELICTYRGPNDPSRVSPDELGEKDVQHRLSLLTGLEADKVSNSPWRLQWSPSIMRPPRRGRLSLAISLSEKYPLFLFSKLLILLEFPGFAALWL